jgi:hypothetical protein
VRALDWIGERRAAEALTVLTTVHHDPVATPMLVSFGSQKNFQYFMHSYAPARFAKEDEAKRAGMNGKHLEAAMRRLFKAGKILSLRDEHAGGYVPAAGRAAGQGHPGLS